MNSRQNVRWYATSNRNTNVDFSSFGSTRSTCILSPTIEMNNVYLAWMARQTFSACICLDGRTVRDQRESDNLFAHIDKSQWIEWNDSSRNCCLPSICIATYIKSCKPPSPLPPHPQHVSNHFKRIHFSLFHASLFAERFFSSSNRTIICVRWSRAIDSRMRFMLFVENSPCLTINIDGIHTHTCAIFTCILVSFLRCEKVFARSTHTFYCLVQTMPKCCGIGAKRRLCHW